MNKSEKFWNRMAKGYDNAEKKDDPTYNKIIEKTKKYLKKSDVVLDFGCGTGKTSNNIAGDVKIVHAIDISSKMIEVAQKKSNKKNIKNIEYSHTTIFDEKYTKESFDAIIVFYVLHLLEDSPNVMKRINELLKPGGLIISVTPCMGEKMFLTKLLHLLGKIGLVPKVISFKVSELIDLFVNGDLFEIDTECQLHSTQEYFLVGKKK